ncbi:MAG: RNA polymerase sigma factor [Chloroflexota bacterium]
MVAERVVLARTGDPSAFEALVEPRVGAMTRTAMAILGSEADARDAVQDALVMAWRELASLREPEAFDAWLTRILVNRCKRGLRGVATRRIREVDVDALAGTAEPGAPDPAAAVLDRRSLERAFERLSVDERSLLVLHHLEGRSVESIAVVLKIPAGTAKSRLHAARKALERSLEREGAR